MYYELRKLCIKENWFTSGSNEQYEKMFELAETDATNREIAIVIWLCTSKSSIEEIETKLNEIRRIRL